MKAYRTQTFKIWIREHDRKRNKRRKKKNEKWEKRNRAASRWSKKECQTKGNRMRMTASAWCPGSAT
jgi:hypothetical protein